MALMQGDGPSRNSGGQNTAVDAFKRALSSGGSSVAAAAQPMTSPYRIPFYVGSSVVHGGGPGSQSLGHEHPDGPHPPKTHEYRDVQHFDLTDDGVNAVIGQWYAMDDAKRAGLMNKMWYLGLIKSKDDFDGAYGVWKNAVTHAANFAAAGKPIDPQDVLDILADSENGPQRAYQGPRTQRQINLTDPVQAKAFIEQAFKQSMGRNPEDAEVRALTEALHQAQKGSPVITTTTPTKFAADGSVIDSTTTSSGGVDMQSFLDPRINDDPEATAHQAAADLFPALMQALGAG